MKIEIEVPNRTIQAMKEYVEQVFYHKLKAGEEGALLKMFIEQVCETDEQEVFWNGIEDCYSNEELEDFFE